MIYKVGISGASGKMGSELTGLLGQGYQIGKNFLELSDVVVGTSRLVSIEGVDVRHFGEPAREPVHVWVDFSRPSATMSLLEEVDCPVVIGTTGFSAQELERIREYSKRHAVLLASNTSPGMVLVRRMLGTLPASVKESFTVVLSEEHHRHKKDAPSGTAKSLLSILEETGFSDVPVHVTRAGAIVGTHTVKLISNEEEIVLSHRVTDRKVFAKGALAGAISLLQKSPGLYTMDDILN